MGIRPNSAKRTQNENVPPSSASSRVINIKSVVLRGQSRRTSRTLRDVQIRKRSENINGVQTTKRIVEHAKLRQTKNKIRFTIRSTIRGKINDVEMADGTIPQSSTNVPIQLPQGLLRPREYKPVTPTMLADVDSTYGDTNVQYFRDGLQVIEKELMQSLSSVKIENHKTKLPSELNVVVNDETVILPSHILAVFGKAPPPGSTAPRQVTLYPVHSLVLKAHCAHLPVPPPAYPPPQHVNGEQTLQLPVWSICLPSPQTYPALSVYLYTKNVQRLMRSLLPIAVPEDLRDAPGRTKEFGQQLGEKFPVTVIVRYTFLIHGLWQNMCALGIFDKDLWDALDAVWNTILFAMSVATGNPSMPIAPYQPIDEGYASEESDAEEECEAGPSTDGSLPLCDLPSSTKAFADAGNEGPETNEPITRTHATVSESNSSPAI